MNKYYRLLEEGELIGQGDFYCNAGGLHPSESFGSKFHIGAYRPHFRPIDLPSQEVNEELVKASQRLVDTINDATTKDGGWKDTDYHWEEIRDASDVLENALSKSPQPETKPEEIKKCPIMRSPDEIPEFWNKLPEMATSAHITYSSIAKRFRDERDQARKELQELFAKKSEPKEELRWITDRQSSEDDGDKFGHVLSIDRSGEVHIRLYNSWSHEHVGWLPTNVLPPYTPAKPSVPTLEEWIVHRWMEISPEEHGDMKDKDIRLWHAKQGMAYQKMVMEQEQSKK